MLKIQIRVTTIFDIRNNYTRALITNYIERNNKIILIIQLKKSIKIIKSP